MEQRALMLAVREDALERLLGEIGASVRYAGTTDSVEGEYDVVFVPHPLPSDGALSLASIRGRWPGSEIVLLVAAGGGEEAAAAAHVLGADWITLPPSRRGSETVQRAFTRRAATRRSQDLVERVRALDPGAAREVAELAAAVVEKERALQEAGRFRSSFINNISHEVRTPVTIMQGMLELLADELAADLSEDQIALLERARESSQQVLDVVQAVLDVSKAEAGLVEPRRSRVYFPDLVADLARATEPLVAKRPVKLVVDVPRGIDWLSVDGTRLRQVLTNLLSNAAKFTASGEIRLAARLVRTRAEGPAPATPASLLRGPAPEGDTLEVVVADTGEGISPADRETIFEAFRQVDVSATRRHEGLGIGLTIVREMTKILGATLELESELGRGTRFRLRIPVVAAEGAQPASAAARAAAARPSRAPGGGVEAMPSDLASLLLAEPASREQAIAFALDFADRRVGAEAVVFAEWSGSEARVVDGVGGLGPGAALPFAAETLERLGRDRRAFVASVETPEAPASAAVAVARDDHGVSELLAARFAPGREIGPDDLRALQIAAAWLASALGRERNVREREEIFATIGRDVKNPLGELLAHTQVLLRGIQGPLAEVQREVVLRIEQTLHRAVLSALDLLDYQRAAVRGYEVESRPFALAAVVDHVLGRHAAAIELGRFRVRKEIPADLPSCRGDLIRTDRVISTLVRVLLEDADPALELSLSAAAAGPRVCLEIRGQPRRPERIVEALRADPRAVRVDDRLGLRLARRWLEAEGGTLTVERAPALTIRLFIPAETVQKS